MDRKTLFIIASIAGIGGLIYYAFSEGSQQFPGIASAVNSVGTAIGGVVNAITGKLSASQIAAYASAAGFQGEDLATAVAVALAESDGNPTAYNPETAAGAPTGKGSYGLWQIYLNAHPEYAGVNLNDPQENANAAFAIYSTAGSQFTPWSTYKSDNYLAFLNAGESAAQNV